MTTRIILIDHLGKRYEVTHSKIQWNTYRTGRPARLTVTCAERDFYPNNGNRVVFQLDGKSLFDGFFFSVRTQKETVEMICYDRLRYLTGKDCCSFYGTTLSQVIRQILKQKGLKAGEIQNTGKYIPEMVCDHQSLLGFIGDGIVYNRHLGGGSYVFYDDVGRLVLRRLDGLKIQSQLRYDSNLLSWEACKEIDTDTYNRILLTQTSTDGVVTRHLAKDDASIRKYGVLQYCARVDRNLPGAQVQSQAQNILQYKKEATVCLKVQALGHPAYRAGFRVLTQYRPEKKARWYVIDEAIHTLEAGQHTMALKLIE